MGGRGQPLATGGVQSDHYLIEALKHVYALRTELGDPDFVNNTPLDSAIASADFALSLAAMVKVCQQVCAPVLIYLQLLLSWRFLSLCLFLL